MVAVVVVVVIIIRIITKIIMIIIGPLNPEPAHSLNLSGFRALVSGSGFRAGGK